MSNGIRIALAGASFAVIGLCGAVPVRAATAANCDWYAKTALKQHQENERRKCGFAGNGWNSDLRGHAAWCAAHPDQWKSEAQRREQQLSTCKK
jgi:hypothetical protein